MKKLAEKKFNGENLKSTLASSGVRVMTRTTAFGLYDNCVVGLLERVNDHVFSNNDHSPRQRFWTIRAKHIILGTGSLERHIAFNNNDVPGMMTANAAKHYLNRYGVLSGQEIAISTNNDSVYATANELAKAGSNVHIIDARNTISQDIVENAKRSGIEVNFGNHSF